MNTDTLSKGPEVHFAGAKDQACFTRNTHVDERRHLFVKITLLWSVGDYLERFKRYVTRSRLYAGKIFKGLGFNGNRQVDSTGKDR